MLKFIIVVVVSWIMFFSTIIDRGGGGGSNFMGRGGNFGGGNFGRGRERNCPYSHSHYFMLFKPQESPQISLLLCTGGYGGGRGGYGGGDGYDGFGGDGKFFINVVSLTGRDRFIRIYINC